MSEETLYERWGKIQDFLGEIDPELRYMAVESAELKHGVLEVTFTRQWAGNNERVTRYYRFAQRPVGE